MIGTFQGASGEEPPVHVGDEILAVDGKSIDEWFAERRPRISASSPGALLRDLVNQLSSAQGKDAIEVLVRNDAGQRSVNLKTIPRPQLVPPSMTPSSQVVSQSSYKILQGGFGYIDLGTLTEKEIDPAFDAIAGKKGLILDMRGYPRTFVQFNLVPRISEKPVHSTIWEVPQVSTPEKRLTATRESFTWINPHLSKRFANPIVVLIDDRAQSAAEDFCIYLRNAKRATFVGSVTTGTNGDVTYIELPGGRQMSFTGMRVKFADGSRFQNIGIIPDVKVEPTIRGIRAGRDEVLEKGIETLEQLVAQAGIDGKR